MMKEMMMTNREMTLLIALVVSLSAAVGLGVQMLGRHCHRPMGGAEHHQGWKHKNKGEMHRRMLQDADADKDGMLTQAEMLAAHTKRVTQMFVDLDGNQDGKLDATELAKGRELMRAKMMQRWGREPSGTMPADGPR